MIGGTKDQSTVKQKLPCIVDISESDMLNIICKECHLINIKIIIFVNTMKITEGLALKRLYLLQQQT